MKTSVKKLAAGTFFALLLLVGNINAKGTEIKSASTVINETSLQLENWMTDETIWNTNSAMFAEFVQETETTLELKDWMTNAETWNLNHQFAVETESGLQLEDWMTNDITWTRNNVEKDAELTIEPWMINKNIWEIR